MGVLDAWGGVGGGQATRTGRLGKVSLLWLTCCDLEQTLRLPGPELPELKCEKVSPVVSNSRKGLAGGWGPPFQLPT